MEKRSTHYGDVAIWIEKVIDSCETPQQTLTASKLITNFRYQLIKNTPDKYWNNYNYEIIEPLKHKLQIKGDSLIKELEK
jgi:hypothetical protein